jgi:hypothetical protein
LVEILGYDEMKGRPKKIYSVENSVVLPLLYRWKALSVTEIKRLLKPRGLSGRGLPSVDKELQWLTTPFPPLSRKEKNQFLIRFEKLKMQNPKWHLERLVEGRKNTHYADFKRVVKEEGAIRKVSKDEEGRLEVVRTKSTSIRKRYCPRPDWMCEAFDFRDEVFAFRKENAKIIHDLLLGAPIYVFDRDIHIIPILRYYLLDMLSLRVAGETGSAWAGFWKLPGDEVLYQLIRDENIYGFLCSEHSYHESIIVDNAVVTLEKKLGIGH